MKERKRKKRRRDSLTDVIRQNKQTFIIWAVLRLLVIAVMVRRRGGQT